MLYHSDPPKHMRKQDPGLRWDIPHSKGTLMGTPNREPQEYNRNIIGIYLPGSLYSIIFLFYSWGSLLFLGFPLKSFCTEIGGSYVFAESRGSGLYGAGVAEIYEFSDSYIYIYIHIYMGGCQNYGPFLGTLNIRGRIIVGTQKGTIILTTIHIYVRPFWPFR